MPIVLKSGSLNLLEPSRPGQACNEIVLPLYIHVCVETGHELASLQNNTTSENFVPKSGAVRSFDWLFITVAPSGGDWANT